MNEKCPVNETGQFMRKEPRTSAMAPDRQYTNAGTRCRFRQNQRISSGQGQDRCCQHHQPDTGCDRKFQSPDTPRTNSTPIIRHRTDPHDRY